jgi:hypothetical protein
LLIRYGLWADGVAKAAPWMEGRGD